MAGPTFSLQRPYRCRHPARSGQREIRHAPHVFRNIGKGKFEEVTSHSAAFAFPRVGRGRRYADINNDWPADLLLSRMAASDLSGYSQTNPAAIVVDIGVAAPRPTRGKAKAGPSDLVTSSICLCQYCGTHAGAWRISRLA